MIALYFELTDINRKNKNQSVKYVDQKKKERRFSVSLIRVFRNQVNYEGKCSYQV